MDGREAGREGALTVDHIIARVEHLERAVTALQRAYVELQASVRPGRQPAPAEEPADTAAGYMDSGDADDLSPA